MAGPSWPEVAGACGNDVFRPQVSAAPLRERTGLRVLVGGAGLRAVDLDSGRVRRVRGADVRRRQVTARVTDGRRTHAIAGRCSTTSSAGEVVRVDGPAAQEITARSTDSLLVGAGESWGLRFGASPGRGYDLRPLGGAPATSLTTAFERSPRPLGTSSARSTPA